MFDLPRSSWDDYDKSLISAGGGVFSREQKSIPISPQMRRRRPGPATGRHRADPARLWSRPSSRPRSTCCGTAASAPTSRPRLESDADVGDRANDLVRVNGNQVRAKVIGEGGNLGVTSLGRVEFDLAGGRINTDAMDNSAGVDCSDHEVNIKILVDSLVTLGKVGADERTALLESMTDEVGRLVLADNASQNDLMGTSRANAASLLNVHARMIKELEATRGLNRELEALPSDKEIRRRTEVGLGLTSPELATLMAHVKLALKDEILASDLPDQDVFAARLPSYFPAELRDRFGPEIRNHQLRREIVATMLVNDLVDTAGISYAYRICDDVGVDYVDAVRTYVATNAIFGIGDVWRRIRAVSLENNIPVHISGPHDAGPAPARRPRRAMAAQLPAAAAGRRRGDQPIRRQGGRPDAAHARVVAWRRPRHRHQGSRGVREPRRAGGSGSGGVERSLPVQPARRHRHRRHRGPRSGRGGRHLLRAHGSPRDRRSADGGVGAGPG